MDISKEMLNSVLYSFLAEAYKSELNEKKADNLLNILNKVENSEPLIQDIINSLKESLENIKANPQYCLLPLGIEYMNIFRGAGPKSVFLYEAVNRSEEGLLFESPYFEVKAFYDQFGFTMEPDWVEPEDHLSIECGFLAFISRKILESHARGDFEQEDYLKQKRQMFLEEHLLKWVPELSGKIIENTSPGFYNQLGNLTESFCQQISSTMNSSF